MRGAKRETSCGVVVPARAVLGQRSGEGFVVCSEHRHREERSIACTRVADRKRGHRHSGQFRLDITNFGNLLNHNWGVGQRVIQNQILTNAAADANGAVSYRLAVVNGALPTTTFQTTAGTADVYTMMVSFRYTFN